VSAVARETLAGAGPPLEHVGRPSAALVFTTPAAAVNSPPRFLSAPGPVARLGESYTSPIRVEDPDGDPVSVRLCGCRPLDDPSKTSCEPPLESCEAPAPAGLAVAADGATSVLQYTPTPAGIGRHLNALVASDGRGESRCSISPSKSSTSRPRLRAPPSARSRPGASSSATSSYQAEVTGLARTSSRGSRSRGPAGMAVDRHRARDPGAGSTASARHGTLEVVDGDPGCSTCVGASLGTQTFTVQVLSNPAGELGPVLSVTPSDRSVGPDTGFADFEVANVGTGSFSWTAAVEPGSEWLTILGGSSGTDDGVLSVAVGANPGETPRTGTNLLAASATSNSSERRVAVHQDGARLAVLAVSPATVVTHDRRAGRVEIAIHNAGSGTLEWSAVVLSGISWLGLGGGFEDNNGVGDGRIVVTQGDRADRRGPAW
jgi:hypothetical protein